MAAIHFRASHIRLIALYYARNMIRGGMGIMFTLTALVVGLTIGVLVGVVVLLSWWGRRLRHRAERMAANRRTANTRANKAIDCQVARTNFATSP